MRRKLVFFLSLFMLLSSLLYVRFNQVEVKASNGNHVYNLNTGKNYTTIQAAINDPLTLDGHTIFVEAGTYHENVVVNKTVTLLGEDRNTTIIDGSHIGNVIRVLSLNTRIINFTIQNSGTISEDPDYNGVFLWQVINTTISSNIIRNNAVGVHLRNSANYTTVQNNIIENNSLEGIRIAGGSNFTDFTANMVVNNPIGIIIDQSSFNTIYHNNIINNTEQSLSFGGVSNKFDNGFEGNYWSDHSGTDATLDGIGDTPFRGDRYPLMGPFSSFNTSFGNSVNIISNSTIKDFKYFESNNTIRIHVSNMTSGQTFGFCRICFPHALMNEPYQVIINSTEPHYVNYNLADDGTHRRIYFSYQHSTLEVVIIPEFQSLIILPLLMIATLLAVTIYRRKSKTIGFARI